MSSLFISTRNTRPVIDDSFRFIRSDVPNKLTDDEVQWLIDHNVTTLVDLRTDAERIKKPVYFASRAEFIYLPLPVFGGDKIPERPDLVTESYMSMLNSRMDEIIFAIEHAESNVLYFCNAGKDRTGVVTALLLLRIGADREKILDDYMQSAENLKAQLKKVTDDHPEIKLDVITPHREYMERFLNTINIEMVDHQPFSAVSLLSLT